MDKKEDGNNVEGVIQPRTSASSDGLGQVLLKYIGDKGFTQREFAAKAKIPPANLSIICSGRRHCGIKLATRFADALGLDGRDRVMFLNLVRMPKWRGSENMPNHPDAILGDLIVRQVASEVIQPDQIASVVRLSTPTDTGADAYVIMKNGDIFEVDIKIRKKKP